MPDRPSPRRETLDHEVALQVHIDRDAPLPDTPHYASALGMAKDALRFTLQELIHTIAVKTSPLSPAIRKSSITASHYLARAYDRRRSDLGFRTLPGSDVRAVWAQYTGIGITCIAAQRLWNFPLKSLEPIKGRGTRFDFRAQRGNLTAILEARGATSSAVHQRQVRDGVAKKKRLRQNDDNTRADIEMVIGTWITKSISTRSSVTFADPISEVPKWTFDDDGELFYETRHWIRVLNFIGARSEAQRLLRLNTGPDIEYSGPKFYQRLLAPPIRKLSRWERDVHATLEVEGETFIGRWIAAPPENDGYLPDPPPVFQGMELGAYLDVCRFDGALERVRDYRLVHDERNKIWGSVHQDFSALFFRT